MNTVNREPQVTPVAQSQRFEPSPLLPVSPMAPPAIPLSDRLKLIGLVALTSALGIGALLLGRNLWQAYQEDRLLPLANESEPQSSLRERVKVITPEDKPETSPPESSASLQPEVGRRTPVRSASQTTLPRTSQGFGSGAPPTSQTDDAEPESEETDDETPESAPTMAAAPTQPRSSPQSASRTVAKGASTSQKASPDQVITALLEAPQRTFPMAPVADAPVTVSPAVSTTPRTLPSHPTVSTTPPTFSEPSVPTSKPPAVGTRPTPSTPEVTSPTLPSVATRPSPTPPVATLAPQVPPGSAAAITAAVSSPATVNEIFVDRLRITGSTRFSQRQLAKVAQDAIAASIGNTPPTSSNQNASSGNPAVDPTLVNRKVSAAALVQASEAITQLYVKKGYINSGAYVPADVLNGAPPEIRVVEGKLESIQVSVQPPKFLWFAQPLSKRYVRRRLARSIWLPLQINQLADAVKLLEQDPLIAGITTKLLPGTTTGGSILKVDVQQANPLHTSLSLDNGRSPSVGRFRQQLSLNHTNILGLGDTLQIGFNRSEGSRGFDLGYTIPINPSNGTLSFSYSSNRGRVIEQPFRDLDIKSRSQNYEVALRQPIRQTSTELLALSLRATHYRNQGVFLETFNNGVSLPLPGRGSDPDGKTRITALRFGQEWLRRGERDVISLQSEFSVGINALGATQLAIPPDGRFFSWQGRGFWVHSFAPDTLFALKGQLQFANRPLVPVEQMSLGGADTVRGYRTSTLLADNAAFASAEFYVPVLRIRKWQSVVQVVPFFDIGRGWNRGDDQPVPNLLISTGLGLQWKVSDTFRARLDWGIPLVNSQVNGQSTREGLFFSVTFTP